MSLAGTVATEVCRLKSLIEPKRVCGTFRGFTEGGLEFHADLTIPYHPDLSVMLLHGSFLLVELSDSEAVVGRVTSLRSEGSLTSPEGEDFLLRLSKRGEPPPEDIREHYLKYRVDLRVLGVVRLDRNGPVFVPSHRRIPHVGSKVAFPCETLLRWLCGHYDNGVPVGFLAMGEFVWAPEDSGGDLSIPPLKPEPWMRCMPSPVLVRFAVHSLISRRTFVFARAGFGKSNVLKLLFSELYRQRPTVPRPSGEAPVGALIFDREAEYFFPDNQGRPGLADVPHLCDKLVVFTERQPPSRYYEAFIAGSPRLDIRRIPPARVVSLALPPDRQEQQNVRKLKSLSMDRWKRLVDIVHKFGNQAELETVKELLGLEKGSLGDVEAMAARSNLLHITRMLHDPQSRFMDRLMRALEVGSLCVVDVSRFSSEAALVFSGIVLDHFFEEAQDRFIRPGTGPIPTIVVIEEAQSVLGGSGGGYAPFVRGVKEGRKYDLGAVMVTQQPGSIPDELLSQGDNWFVFHLLSGYDLKALQRANAHFSDDLLSSLLNEPIRGQCIYWSGVSGRPYPVSFMARSFELENKPLQRTEPPRTFADYVRSAYPEQVQGDESSWFDAAIEAVAAELAQDSRFIRALEEGTIAWRGMFALVDEHLQLAKLGELGKKQKYEIIKAVLNQILGPDGWRSEARDDRKRIQFAVEAARKVLGRAAPPSGAAAPGPRAGQPEW